MLLTAVASVAAGAGASVCVCATPPQSAAAGSVTPENIDAVAKRSMPLCMQKLHATLKRDHKLKHQGRQQYWLFLKVGRALLGQAGCICVWEGGGGGQWPRHICLPKVGSPY